jgi:NAD(P)H-dependent FMN reductase
MRILIVEASLKAVNKPSNTRVLCRVAKEALEREGADVVVRALKGMKYDFSTNFAADDGGPDDMTELLRSVLDMDAVIVATPIWWGVHSSLAQSFIERIINNPNDIKDLMIRIERINQDAEQELAAAPASLSLGIEARHSQVFDSSPPVHYLLGVPGT